MLTERHWCCVSVNHFIQEKNSAKWINKEVSCLAFCFATTGDSTRFFAYLRSHFVCEKVLADASFMFGLLLCSFACWRFSKNALYQTKAAHISVSRPYGRPSLHWGCCRDVLCSGFCSYSSTCFHDCVWVEIVAFVSAPTHHPSAECIQSQCSISPQ